MTYIFTLIFNPYDFDHVSSFSLPVHASDFFEAVIELQDFISYVYSECVVSYNYTMIDSDGIEQCCSFSTDFYNEYLLRG